MAGVRGAWLLAKLYGGFFVVDLRLLLWLVMLCLLVAAGGVLVWQRGRAYRQLIPVFLGAFGLLFLIGLVVLHWVAGYPVFVIRSFFQLP